MLAVVAVGADQGLAAAFADQVAEGVVVVVAVALLQQAVALEGGRAGAVLHQQVAGRVVAEVFRRLAVGKVDAGQAIQRVVLVAAAVSVVGKGLQVALGAVGIIAPEQLLLSTLPHGLGLETALFIVVVVTEQLALLALPFAPAVKAVFGQARAVEVDGGQCATRGMVVVELAVVRQAQVVEAPASVVAITQGAPALVLADQAVLGVVFEGQRMIAAVVDVDQSAQLVVAVFDGLAVGQGLDPQPPGRVALVLGEPL